MIPKDSCDYQQYLYDEKQNSSDEWNKPFLFDRGRPPRDINSTAYTKGMSGKNSGIVSLLDKKLSL